MTMKNLAREVELARCSMPLRTWLDYRGIPYNPPADAIHVSGTEWRKHHSPPAVVLIQHNDDWNNKFCIHDWMYDTKTKRRRRYISGCAPGDRQIKARLYFNERCVMIFGIPMSGHQRQVLSGHGR